MFTSWDIIEHFDVESNHLIVTYALLRIAKWLFQLVWNFHSPDLLNIPRRCYWKPHKRLRTETASLKGLFAFQQFSIHDGWWKLPREDKASWYCSDLGLVVNFAVWMTPFFALWSMCLRSREWHSNGCYMTLPCAKNEWSSMDSTFDLERSLYLRTTCRPFVIIISLFYRITSRRTALAPDGIQQQRSTLSMSWAVLYEILHGLLALCQI